jgi:DNA-binding CsgD family transcriptional regulator
MNVNEGEVAAISTLIPYEEFLASRLYTEWARPQGYVDSIHACVERSGSSFASLSFARDESQGVADANAFERMRQLAPHFRRAVSVGNSIHQNRVDAAALADTLDRIAASLFILDASRIVVHANAAGKKLLDAGMVFRTASNRLAPVDPIASRLLAEAVASAEQGDLSMASSGVAIPIEGADAGNWIAHVLPLTSGERRRAGLAYSAVAAVFVRKANLDYSTPVETAARLYRLTDAELRVLFAFMASDGIADAAAILGLSQTTVRTHLKSVFRKTGTNRQSALVKLVASFSNPLT